MHRRLIRCAIAALLALLTPTARAQDAPAPEVPPAPTVVTQPAARTAAPRLSPQAVANALQRYRHEPSAQTLIDAALRHLRVDPRRVSELASRAHDAGWMPTLRMSARRGQTIDLLAAQTTTTDRNSASSGNDLVLEGQLSFDLARVIWSGQEPRLERELRAERQAQQELIESITTLYFERRRLQLERDLLTGITIQSEMRIAQLEAWLDALTQGALSRGLRRPRDGAREDDVQ